MKPYQAVDQNMGTEQLRHSKFRLFALSFFLAAINIVELQAATITNPGFENGWQGWMEIDKDGKSAAISGDSNEGEKAVKLTSSSGTFAQVISVKPNTHYTVSAQVSGAGIVGIKMGKQLVFERQPKTRSWKRLEVSFNSGNYEQVAIFAQYNGNKGLFDDFSIVEQQGQESQSIRVDKGGLSPDFPPGRNFDLTDWYLNTPADSGDGRSKRISERELTGGYQDQDFFYTADDGGMVFRATIAGKKTSKNTRYTRSELREMLRRGNTEISTRIENAPNKNNWVFSSAPSKAQNAAGGIDGTLKATLAINHVTTTGEAKDVGRLVIGQIHAKTDEPARLYYRKLPANERGSLYVAHEISGGDDEFYEIIGSRSSTARNPVDGIALNEQFSYEITANGHDLQVSVSQKGVLLGRVNIDMTHSGYDVDNDYMYFKAGVYNQNDTGEPDDFVQATFYSLENQHNGYDF